MKNVLSIHGAPRPHWVGNGFPVRSLFSYHELGRQLSPFLLLDYAGPARFEPTRLPRGVGSHPHRGFETVTIVLDGEVAHRDSTGQGGVIGPGDVQWMTAGAGIVHEEFHSDAFRERGGQLEMVQLWVNLPARHKMTPPGYQGIDNGAIPVVAVSGGGELRVIAGDYGNRHGPARTFSPMQVWDLKLNPESPVTLPLMEDWNSALVVLRGGVRINDRDDAKSAELVLLEREGDAVKISATTESRLLVLSGEPIDEPIVGHGPFVMNSETEIVQAIDDFNSGRFGVLT